MPVKAFLLFFSLKRWNCRKKKTIANKQNKDYRWFPLTWQVVNVLTKQKEISAWKLNSWPVPKGYFKTANTSSLRSTNMATMTSRANDLSHVLKKKRILVRWSAITESCPTTEITLHRVFKLNKNQANHSIAIYLFACNLPLGTNLSSDSVRRCTNTTLAVGPLQTKAMRGMGKKLKSRTLKYACTSGWETVYLHTLHMRKRLVTLLPVTRQDPLKSNSRLAR